MDVVGLFDEFKGGLTHSRGQSQGDSTNTSHAMRSSNNKKLSICSFPMDCSDKNAANIDTAEDKTVSKSET